MSEIIGKKTLWQGEFLKCVDITYLDSSGKTRKWEACERVKCDGIVAIVPITDRLEAVMIRQFRPAVNSYVIEFPAGLNDKGESKERAAQRELLEETGYTAEDMLFLAEGPLSSGLSNEVLNVFLARGLKYKGIGERDETEDIEVFLVPLKELADRLAVFMSEGNYVDLKIFGLIELAKKYL